MRSCGLSKSCFLSARVDDVSENQKTNQWSFCYKTTSASVGCVAYITTVLRKQLFEYFPSHFFFFFFSFSVSFPPFWTSPCNLFLRLTSRWRILRFVTDWQLKNNTPVSLNSTPASLHNTPVRLNRSPVSLNSSPVGLI